MTSIRKSFEDQFSVASLMEIMGSLKRSHTDVFTGKVFIRHGADGITWSLFERDHDKHLRAISRKVLDGRYTFSPLLEFEKDKPGSKEKRIISVSCIRDSIVQIALYKHLYDQVDALLTDSIYGYRHGRSAHDAVRQITRQINNGNTYIFDADFSKFFDTVDHDIMLAKIRVLGINATAEKMFRRWLKSSRIEASEVQRHENDQAKGEKYQTTSRIRGLPQGGVLSGMASNLYLADFDQKILFLSNGYIRYADDFVVCCDSEAKCKEVRTLAEEEANKLKQELHPDKTKTCALANTGVDFLGFNIGTDWVRVRSKNIAKFKNRITKIIASHHKRTEVKRSLKALVHRLSYKIRGPKPEDVAKLTAAGHMTHPHRRSWVGFFRIVTDETQIRDLDRWVRGEISRQMWKDHHEKITYKDMQAAGLPSLIGYMHKARRRFSVVTSNPISPS